MQVKKFVKNLLMIIYHPIVFVNLFFKGARDFYIAPRMQINDLKYFSVGKNVNVGYDSRFLLVEKYCGGTYKPEISIGSNISIGNRFSALAAAPIKIGDNCLIASDVLVTSENHGMDLEKSDSYNTLPLTAKAVEIGAGCWIGEKVSILPGVELGERCIVAANSVVTKSFPTACLIGGNPARIIKRYNFQEHKWEKTVE